MPLTEPIAIVARGGIFPNAADPHQLWRNVVRGLDSAAEAPSHRWIASPERMVTKEQAPDRAYSRHCCLIHEWPRRWQNLHVEPSLLQALDPLYHFVIEAGLQAFQGCRNRVAPEKCGVVLAAIALPTDASSRLTRTLMMPLRHGKSPRPQPVRLDDGNRLACRVTGFPAALLARALGFEGVTFTIDAACASSLFAIKLAVDELRSGRADLMLAGGVSRPDCLYTQVGFSQLQALSPSGRCAPFDARADGLVVGEGAGMVALKRLSDALRQGDRIQGVIRGIGLSNDLRGNLLAPDSEGQLRAMRSAYIEAGWPVNSVEHIECHGAGTPVGDATELKSLGLLWQDQPWQTGQCAIGSVKGAIGHLLTAAGAAGVIKTLLALEHETLPPTPHFHHPPAGSPLEKGPFRALSRPEPWLPSRAGQPRRAAVSAFGFGGINAHILIEEWRADTGHGERSHRTISAAAEPPPAAEAPFHRHARPDSVAIVGMGAAFGNLPDLAAFQRAVLRGTPILTNRPAQRWHAAERRAPSPLHHTPRRGAFMEALEIATTSFRIPPLEIPDILPQHLLMLQVAAAALADAGRTGENNERTRCGIVVGMDFDPEATRYQLRWSLAQSARSRDLGQEESADESAPDGWSSAMADAAAPPLTASRVLGGLGSMIASRLAREFRCGGPSFTLSAGAGSGLKALEIGAAFLNQGLADAMIVGAVDLAGDLRTLVQSESFRSFTEGEAFFPLDGRTRGTLPGEGAGALVLKRLADARADGNRIYAVITGTAHASGGTLQTPGEDACQRSLQGALDQAGLEAQAISYLEANGSGDPKEDTLEARAVSGVFRHQSLSCAVGSVKAILGHCGAASGIAALIKTALCLYQEILPPLPNFRSPGHPAWAEGPFHFPLHPQYWVRNRIDGPRRALVAAMDAEGGSLHAVLQGVDEVCPPAGVQRGAEEKRHPLGPEAPALFVVRGESPPALLDGLSRLEARWERYHQTHAAADLAELARAWQAQDTAGRSTPGLALMVSGDRSLPDLIADARRVVSDGRPQRMPPRGGIHFSPHPLGSNAGIALLYPGSGNHYPGMGRELGVLWPDLMRAMDAQTPRLANQMRPERHIPWRTAWEAGWEAAAQREAADEPLALIQGQVMHALFTTRLLAHFGITPSAAIGYSLGESAALVATGAWPDRDLLLERAKASPLFTVGLAGPCTAARTAWGLDNLAPLDWSVAVVNRPARQVRGRLAASRYARLLIVNTPDQCVIGGHRPAVEKIVADLRCEAVWLDRILAVHCDAAAPVAREWRALHHLPTIPPAGVLFYSGATARPFRPSAARAAGAILRQGLHGIDYPATIRRAWRDGLRFFLEMGPQGSCSAMVDRILGDKPHLALPIDGRGEMALPRLASFLGTLCAEGLPVHLERLFAPDFSCKPAPAVSLRQGTISGTIRIPLGGPGFPEWTEPLRKAPTRPVEVTQAPGQDAGIREIGKRPSSPDGGSFAIEDSQVADAALIGGIAAAGAETARAHREYLRLSAELGSAYARGLSLQARSMHLAPSPSPAALAAPLRPAPLFTRADCREFAVGSVARVLGPAFADLDGYPSRVRLPDEPLMLVDRILLLEGGERSLGPGRIVTEHEVPWDAWYLDGGRAPASISIEAGQADLFLCSFLGIDHQVKGLRQYRLLDATVTFRRGLPRPGETIRYDIRIEKFIRHAQTWLFFFNFKGSIAEVPFIEMENGCAGFFTPEEVRRSGGILSGDESPFTDGAKRPAGCVTEIPAAPGHLDEAAVAALRRGDLSAAFGEAFIGKGLAPSLCLPDGRLALIQRVPLIEPRGGRHGLGMIRAEAAVKPDDWYLTCHFKDDMTMPGTLMYEGCQQTLRILLLRLGWTMDSQAGGWAPVAGIAARLKCRGPVTPATRLVTYQVEIREIGRGPAPAAEPHAVADALLFADGRPIVRLDRISLQLCGSPRVAVGVDEPRDAAIGTSPPPFSPPTPRWDRQRILTFALGNPSEAFGEPYRVFDSQRRMARLPNPPYLFMDRITRIEPPPWVLEPGGWIETEVDIPADAWYLRAEGQPTIPYAVLNEIALQPCGWLAAWMGSALHSAKDLKFRNLGGQATLHRPVRAADGTLRTRARLARFSRAGDMLIEHFDFEVHAGPETVYEGQTTFGFFTSEALTHQKGLQSDDTRWPAESPTGKFTRLERKPPLDPLDPKGARDGPLGMPGAALAMIERIVAFPPADTASPLPLIVGDMRVDPKAWYFKAHFFQDPVWPGSLGLEAFVQLLKWEALRRWPGLHHSHRFVPLCGQSHTWTYRGQVLPSHRHAEVAAFVSEIVNGSSPALRADGQLRVDGVPIYAMQNFGLKLVPRSAAFVSPGGGSGRIDTMRRE